MSEFTPRNTKFDVQRRFILLVTFLLPTLSSLPKTFEPCHRYGIGTKANVYLYFSKLHDEFEQRWVEPFNLEEWSSSHES